jgi:hypothetical protein
MNSRSCLLCRDVFYGRADKRYCSATCRRNACRIRERTIHLGQHQFVGSEISKSLSIEKYVIPRLERDLGRHHREISKARRAATAVRETELEQLAEVLRQVLDL